jgi:predicted GNAT family acetyltransferase
LTDSITPEDVIRNEAENRFEVELNGALAQTQYVHRGRKILFTHTEVPPAFEGQGVGNALARAALDYAKREGLRVVPLCPFIAAFIKRHKEYQSLVEDEASTT